MNDAEFWLEEKIPGFHVNRFVGKEKLFFGQSDFQKVEIVNTQGYGRMLLNDGLVMVTERDEFIYHEMMAHVPLFVHPGAQSVLIIGGGDGGTLREVLRHRNIEKCVLVEIDKMVVEACQRFLPSTAAAMTNDPRASVRIEDGVKFAARTSDKFDIILIDSTDPIGPATPLFGENFYRDVKRILNPGGIVVAQGESPFFNTEMQRTLLRIQKQFFQRCHFYNFSNLTYPGGLWSFTFASDDLCPLQNFVESRVGDSQLEFSYYSPGIHRAAFTLPEFQRKNLSV